MAIIGCLLIISKRPESSYQFNFSSSDNIIVFQRVEPKKLQENSSVFFSFLRFHFYSSHNKATISNITIMIIHQDIRDFIPVSKIWMSDNRCKIKKNVFVRNIQRTKVKWTQVVCHLERQFIGSFFSEEYIPKLKPSCDARRLHTFYNVSLQQ